MKALFKALFSLLLFSFSSLTPTHLTESPRINLSIGANVSCKLNVIWHDAKSNQHAGYKHRYLDSDYVAGCLGRKVSLNFLQRLQYVAV